MPNTITTTVLQKNVGGGHRTIFHIGITGDASGEESNLVIIDPVVDLGLTVAARLVIERVDYNFIGFDGILSFDTGGGTDPVAWCLSRELGFTSYDPDTGVKDYSAAGGSATGKLQISTIGLADAGSVGTMIIRVRNS